MMGNEVPQLPRVKTSNYFQKIIKNLVVIVVTDIPKTCHSYSFKCTLSKTNMLSNKAINIYYEVPT